MDDHTPTYETKPQRSIAQWIKSQPIFDWLYAAYENTRWSAREIEPFVRKYHIDMGEFEPVAYRSFAEFFDRRFRAGVRKFPSAPGEMGAFAEARYFAWDRVAAEQRFPVKGHSLSPEQILGNAQRARPFIGGPVLLVRLAPVDYHHVHYPDHGRTLDHDRRGHRLWTVNWHALLNKPDILFSNERNINILATRHFGRLAFVEVGALSVGRIVQVHPLDAPFQRGEEKSVFRFGGSAIVVFGEPRMWRPSDDLLEHTKGGRRDVRAARRTRGPAKSISGRLRTRQNRQVKLPLTEWSMGARGVENALSASFVELSFLSCVPWKAQSRSPACGFSPCLPCRRGRSWRGRVCSGASRGGLLPPSRGNTFFCAS
jgi:phosphatidylserine decarboxylase